jgi:hypothetical protein
LYAGEKGTTTNVDVVDGDKFDFMCGERVGISTQMAGLAVVCGVISERICGKLDWADDMSDNQRNQNPKKKSNYRTALLSIQLHDSIWIL